MIDRRITLIREATMSQRFVRSDILEMEEYVPVQPLDVLSRELGIPPHRLVKLDANENPYGPAPAVSQALARCDILHIYPDPMQNQLRDALSQYLGLSRDIILAGAGSDELIDLIMRLLLRPGDAILNCPPTFGMYAFDAALHGVETIPVPRDAYFRLDLEGIARAANSGTAKVLFLASPNNPDGGLITNVELESLLALPLLIVLDEAYAEFAGQSYIDCVPKYDNLIVLRTFSKWAGLAGVRVGYGVFPPSLMPHLWKIKQPYNVSITAQVAVMVSLQEAPYLKQVVETMIAEREVMRAGLRSINWLSVFPSSANFILCRVVGRPAVEVKMSLRRQGILIRHFDKPGVADCVRFSVGRPEQTEILLSALAQL